MYWVSVGWYDCMFVVTGGGVVVLDAPPAVGERLLSAIEEVTDEPVTHLIYSHWHADHIGAATMFGPGITIVAHERTRDLLARFPDRGGPITEGPLADGAFYRPTLLEVHDPGMDLVQEEVFGPVLTMQVFDTEAEAIALANDSRYGLAASIWSRDVDQPLRVAKELEVGTVWVNDWAVTYDEFEEGGYKDSGQGRLNGLASLEDFTEYKHIALRPGSVDRTA